ncbi:MAG: trimeric autotransporter adhesin [Candidatus Parcubacteria bacterium]|jgi:hypothetical protein
MKKILSSFIALEVLLLTVFIAIPVSAEAKVITCPGGYTCTAACVTGYVVDSSGNCVPVAGACYVFSINLQLGSYGADVVALQDFLLRKGFKIADLSVGKNHDKGYFGGSTLQALRKYQSSVGIEATGYFGPTTRMKVNADCVPTPPSGTQPSVAVQFISADTTVSAGPNANDDVGTFQIKYKVTAVDGDVYISSTTASALNYIADRAGTPLSSSNISATIVDNTDGTLTGTGNFLVEEGDSESFTLTVSVPLGGTFTSGQYRVSLTGVKWGIADDTIPENVYTSLAGFATSYTALNLNDLKDPFKRSALTASLWDTLKSYIFAQ